MSASIFDANGSLDAVPEGERRERGATRADVRNDGGEVASVSTNRDALADEVRTGARRRCDVRGRMLGALAELAVLAEREDSGTPAAFARDGVRSDGASGGSHGIPFGSVARHATNIATNHVIDKLVQVLN